jgi:hypothetical protein
MIMKKMLVGIIFVSLMFVCFSGPAMAASATASAMVDLSAFNNVLFSWGATQTSSTYATASDKNGAAPVASDGAIPGWSALTSTAIRPEVTATGSAVNGVYTSVATATEFGYSEPIGYAWAGLNSNKGFGTASFTYTGSAGLVPITIPFSYYLYLDVQQGDDAKAYGAYGYWLIVTAPNNETQKFAGTGIEKIIGGTVAENTLTESAKSSYTFTLNLVNGQEVQIDYGTYARVGTSAVPIPAAFWLLGSGLIGLVGIRRKKVL